MHYFSLMTSDYCNVAQIGLISFFKYNDVVLNLYVCDNGYKKVVDFFKDKDYYDKLNIVNVYIPFIDKLIYSFKHNSAFFTSSIALMTLWTFYILDIVGDDELVRVDLDVLYFASLKPLAAITDCSLCGAEESNECKRKSDSVDPLNHTPEHQINVGICKFNKNKFRISDTFAGEMIARMNMNSIHYLVPEQDILNELAVDKKAYTKQTIIVQYMDITTIDYSKEIAAFHFNGTYTKPWINYAYNQIFKSNFIFCCGIKLFKEFSKKYNLFTKTVTLNEFYTKFQMNRKHDEEETKLLNATDSLIEKIKEW